MGLVRVSVFRCCVRMSCVSVKVVDHAQGVVPESFREGRCPVLLAQDVKPARRVAKEFSVIRKVVCAPLHT